MNARSTRHSRLAQVTFATFALGATATLAVAAGPHGPPPPPPPLEDRVECLDLDDATRDKIYAVLDAAEGPRRQNLRALESARRRMRALLADGASSDDAIRAADQELDQLEHRAHQQHVDVLLKVRATLPEKLRGSLAPPAPPAPGERGESGARREGPPPGGGRCGERGPRPADGPAGPRDG